MKLDYTLAGDHAFLTVSTAFFPLDIIYAAAYIMLKDAYIVFDGDPSKEVQIFIRPKGTTKTPEELAVRFHDELINFAVYRKQAEQNKDIRQTFLQRALLTAQQPVGPRQPIPDPEGIAVPWEEKYGKTSHQHH